ncbi:class I SAM-dependent methyltransferase [Pseudonocardia aurantiaca]|uniref:Class I SAM-dependent methyltransferase n=1 Tax=Pseudonocardia aurantiaca TaxID=75290 RepID=A0ABW4G1B1_9PSEU
MHTAHNGRPHDARPDDAAVAERLLRTATDRSGAGPLPWVAAPLADASRVLDVRCGAGPLAGQFRPGRWIGVDQDARAGTGRPVLRAAPDALPVADNAVDGVVLLLALPVLPDVNAVFAEVRRVLRPTGTLVVVVPSAATGSLAELRTAPLLSAVHRRGWVNRSALDNTGWLLAAADFAVLTDDRVPFTLPVPDAAAAHALAADLPRAGLWPPALPAAARERAASGLARRAGPGRTLPVPLRRVVARR